MDINNTSTEIQKRIRWPVLIGSMTTIYNMILIGPSDWEDHSLGKEGATRYRIHNLPKGFEPGVYELGIAVSHSGLGRDIRKLDPTRIVVVYLGQAGNVRSRLQSYGQSGSHLVQKNPISKSNCHWDDNIQNGSGLFDDIFSRGYPIVFRWAPMASKKEAVETEARLLEKFDYAWNKEYNNARRPDDIYKKLDKVAASTIWFSKITRILQKKVGIRIKSSNHHPIRQDNQPKSIRHNHLFSGVLNFSRSRPRYNLGNPDTGDSSCELNCYYEPETGDMENSPGKVGLQICGVILEDGTPCRKLPVPTRKRCQEHKGRRIHVMYNAIREENIASTIREEKNNANVEHNTQNNQDQRSACAVELGDGKKCSRQPNVGRKRCQEHKGMKVNSLVTKQDKFNNSY
uniref:Uncharacterized protein n=1 Tax=Kalanchoe fedtschenkoi TaxID=63787 RepID=A0A7N0UV44_KALFE